MYLINLLVLANNELSILNTNTKRITDMKLFISMYVRKEALLSSQIEGIQVSLDDILDPNSCDSANIDVSEVINTIKALEFGIKRLNTLPLSMRLLKECHSKLLKDARGQEKNPGELRRSQNWIGPIGSTLKTARFIPPTPNDMKEALNDLDKYMHSETSLNHLIQATLIHYQFETIHPFLDGNGRLGRLLIILYLMEKNVLDSPSLYISYYLKKNRIEYYDRMMDVRDKGNFEQWILFFLKAIFESAKDANECIETINTLHQKNLSLIM